jgi:hypothetical protein
MGTKFQDRYESSQIPRHYHRLKQKKDLNGLCHELCNICMMRSESMWKKKHTEQWYFHSLPPRQPRQLHTPLLVAAQVLWWYSLIDTLSSVKSFMNYMDRN